MFVVPFVFAFYPELLLIEAAVIDPSATAGGAYLAGYDGTTHIPALVLLLVRLVLALYLLSSALSAFDRRALAPWEIAARLALAALVMTRIEAVYIAASLAALLLIFVPRKERAHA
jgi:TRAP-type uncharacterized transport system fused permease subunit